MWEDSLTTLRGIGEKRAESMKRLGLFTVRDLVNLLPRDYIDYSYVQPVATLSHGDLVAVRVRIETAPKLARIRKNLSVLTAFAQDETGRICLTWYNQPYRASTIAPGVTTYALGRVDRSRGLKLLNPTLCEELPGIVPVYPLTQGLSQQQLRASIETVLKRVDGSFKETLPLPLRTRFDLAEINFSYRNLHFPRDKESLEKARRRFVFENVLQYLLVIASFREERLKHKGTAMHTEGLTERFTSLMPYRLTGAQMRAMHEIAEDLSKPVPMNRLLQGDVGSGKTVLALFCLYAAVQNGLQGALMAPTDILAQQHYASLQRLFGDEACLLTGGMKKKERDAIKAKLASGQLKAVVGTHALLQEDVAFKRLGVVIADEQHRFGVRQRAAIADKGEAPDVLIMSATPIPRTLSLILYGDLDVSILDELPPGRKPIKTRYVPGSRRDDMYAFLGRQAGEGKQAYVVCPLVEKSESLTVKSAEEVYRELLKKLPNVSIGLLHGQMSAQKKQQTIEDFRAGSLSILVSTTVVEVGVDVPNAVTMVIEDADRFGLAQLHQLRGRVGRGAEESYCFLLSDTESETALSRLNIMVKSNNGFEIAEQDLLLRGPGQFLGEEQHGMGAAARLATDMEALTLAQKAVSALQTESELTEYYLPLMKAACEKLGRELSGIAHN